MATKTIEVSIGKVPDRPIDPEKIGKAAPAPSEVEGRDDYDDRYAEFTCGHVILIRYDEDRYLAYECPIDGTINWF